MIPEVLRLNVLLKGLPVGILQMTGIRISDSRCLQIIRENEEICEKEFPMIERLTVPPLTSPPPARGACFGNIRKKSDIRIFCRKYSSDLHFRNVSYDLFPKRGKVILDNVPKDFKINLVVIMDKDVPHFFYHLPGSVCMTLFKLFRELEYSLSYYLNIVCNSMKVQRIFNQILIFQPLRKHRDIINGCQNVLQTSFIPNWLSHKSTFYRGQLTLERMAEDLLQPQDLQGD